jgi:ABC-type Mn2+/Zn2+ transport system permease subunit
MVRMSIHTMLEYDFIRNALIASGIAAIVAGITGYSW